MTLNEWHQSRKTHPRHLDCSHIGCSDLTVITYIYGAPDYVESHFYQIENALRETWFQLGMLKSVLVTNHITPSIEAFRATFRDWLRIEICTSLKPGDLYEYSRDCIANLHKRFDTPYVLFVHPDGFPLRSGIEEFIGKYDYIGAPWTDNDDIWGRLLLSQSHRVGNGGFSLRSHAICEEASHLYKRFWKIIPNCFLLYEDYFFCRFLTKFNHKYKQRFSFPTTDEATSFALENFHKSPLRLPLGFHSATAFEQLYAEI